MDYVRLGRSGLSASVLGLGGGSSSRFGLVGGGSRADAVALIRKAFDLGITLFDGAGAVGGVDEILGEAVQPFRHLAVLSSKVHIGPDPVFFRGNSLPNRAAMRIASALDYVCSGDVLRRRVENCLKSLGTAHIDILHLHAVSPGQYPAVARRLAPTLMRLKEEGKIRAIGITEAFLRDPGHVMLQAALDGSFADTVMAGFNLFANGAAKTVFPSATRQDVGVIAMSALRGVARHEREIGPLLAEHGIPDLAHLAYRYCRHHAGVDVVLTGTGDIAHLRRNVDAALSPPLPAALLGALARLSNATPSSSR